MAIAPILPFIDAALTSKNLALTTADHVLHYVSAYGANKLFNLLTMLVYNVILGQSLGRTCNLFLGDALYHGTNALDKLNSPFFGLLHLLCHRGDTDPREGIFVSCWLSCWTIESWCNLGLGRDHSRAIR